MPYVTVWDDDYEDYEAAEDSTWDENSENPWKAEPAFNEAGKPKAFYRAAQAHFDPQQIKDMPITLNGDDPGLAFQILLDLGVTKFHCSYDGGGDDGCARLEAACIDNRWISRRELCALLADGPLGEFSPEVIGQGGYLVELEPAERVGVNLDYLSDDFAYFLLGGGWGTGEVSITGTFIADFETHQIVDQEKKEI